MNESNQLPAPPRSSVDPRSPGLRTYDGHSGTQPVSVDSQGNYIYAPQIYGIFFVLVVGLFVAWLFLRRAKVSS